MTVAQYTLVDKEDAKDLNKFPNKCCRYSSYFVIIAIAFSLLGFFLWKPPVGVLVSNGSGVHRYPPPPPHTEYARVARYIVHISDWAALATESSHPGIQGYPFANVFSISDGTLNNSSGTPYFYFTSMELSVHDLHKNPQASLTASLAQSDYCTTQHLDPQDPLCAHVILTGEIVKIGSDSDEEKFAREALFTRHPEMRGWPSDHGWFFARLAIIHIYLLDYFGGAKVITPEEYYAAPAVGAE